MKNVLIAIVSLFLFQSFKAETPYEVSIKNWQQKRIDGLKAEDGWLNLAGLFWLEEGENTIGGDKKNTVIFPTEHSDAFVGKAILKNGIVSFIANKNTVVKSGTEMVTNTDIFPYKDKPIVLAHNSLRWFVIKRGDKYAIRLRDLESLTLKEFKGIETFPISQNWKVKATFVPTIGKKLRILDITGRAFEEDSPGKLVFTIDGKEYSLEATGTKENLSFVFGDATNKHDTYGGGRFLDAEKPDADGIIYLDFNKAYNPPCAFTPFATCPLPTKENKLPIAINAGEMYHGNH
ncbi:MAG: DUF1684 domain-containing protein [Bacteroidota bacterium]|jgi:uncharacterized protein (DUF1684 family)